VNLARHIHRERVRSGDAGDTLVELLVALAIISICVVGLIGGLASAIGSAGNHRNLTNLDAALKDFAEVVRYDVQLQPYTSTSAPLYARCASKYLLAGTPNPSSGPVGTAVTAFGSGFSGSVTSSVSIGGSPPPGNTVTLTDPANGNVTANFVVPPLPAGTYPITISDGGTASSTTGYTVTPWIGGLSVSSGPIGTHVTVPVTGFGVGKSLSVKVGTAGAVFGGTTNGTGRVTASFNIPGGLPNGPQPVVITDTANNSARTTFTVGPTVGSPGVGGAIVSSSPLANYKVGISGIGYWSGKDFSYTQAQCLASSGPNNDIQQISISGSAPGAADQLNTVVSNPLFVPTPTVTTTLDTANSTDAIGGRLIFNATVAGPTGGQTPTGTISWQIDVTSGLTAPTCAAKDPNNGIPYDPTTFNTSSGNSATATCVIYGANLTATTYTVTANYSGDGNYNAASGTAFPVAVPKGLQNITIQNPSPTPVYGQPITFTATVTVPNNAPAPQGTVTWTVSGPGGANSCNGGTTQLQPTSPPSNSFTATCKITSATVGTYTVTATVAADTNYNAAGPTSDTLTVAPLPTTTSVVASPSSQTVGGTIQFTATVTGSGPPALTGAVTWSGVTCNSQTFNISSTTGTAVCNVTATTAGNYRATATYGSDPLYASSSGTSPTVTVSLATPTVTVTGATAGGTVTFTATVAGPAGGATPTGTGTWTVSGPVSACNINTLLTGTGNPPGTATATCVIPKANAGLYTVSYSYSGDPNYNPASGSTTYTVNQVTPTVVITAVMHKHTLTFTSTVTGTAGGPTPTGSATWTVSGPGVSTCTATALTGSGNPQGTATATCAVSGSPPTGAPAGDYTVTYNYGGDPDYNAASSNATFHVPSLVLIGTPNGNGSNEKMIFTATLNISPGVPAPNGTVNWTISGAASSCTGGTAPLAPVGTSQTTYQATCTVNGANNHTYNATVSFPGDGYYLPADDSLTGVQG
jgi:type II secretory pathway pseudopilin PulG